MGHFGFARAGKHCRSKQSDRRASLDDHGSEARSQEGPKRVLREHRREISVATPHRSLSKGYAERAVSLREPCPDPCGDGMAPRASGALWPFGPVVWILREHTGGAEHARVLPATLLFDRSDRSLQKPQPGGLA